ncbi:MAG: DUF1573 domain-containing protein [Muribaculaceae bacterium]
MTASATHKALLAAIAVALCVIAAPRAHAQGVLTWLTTEHDFGTFNEGDIKKSAVFVAVNTGNEPVVIERVQVTCGCTTPLYTQTPIAVGDTARVTLTYHAAGRVGSFNKTAIVYTNTPQRRMVLHIKGNALASKATINEIYPHNVGELYLDRNIIAVGEVLRGSSKMGYIGAYNNSTDTLTVSFDHVPPHINIEAFPPRVPPFGLCTISAYFNSQNSPEWGFNSSDIGVSVATSQGTQGATHISISGVVKEDFSQLSNSDMQQAPIATIINDVIDFGDITAGAIARVNFDIFNSGKRKLLLRRLYCPDKAIAVNPNTNEVRSGASCTVSLAVNPEMIKGSYLNTRLQVITNDPVHTVQELRLVGIVKQ